MVFYEQTLELTLENDSNVFFFKIAECPYTVVISSLQQSGVNFAAGEQIPSEVVIEVANTGNVSLVSSNGKNQLPVVVPSSNVPPAELHAENSSRRFVFSS